MCANPGFLPPQEPSCPQAQHTPVSRCACQELWHVGTCSLIFKYSLEFVDDCKQMVNVDEILDLHARAILFSGHFDVDLYLLFFLYCSLVYKINLMGTNLLLLHNTFTYVFSVLLFCRAKYVTIDD